MIKRLVKDDEQFWQMQKVISLAIILLVLYIVMIICDLRIDYYEKKYGMHQIENSIHIEIQPVEKNKEKEQKKFLEVVSGFQEKEPVCVREEFSIPILEENNQIIEGSEEWFLAKGIHGEASICDDAEKYRVGTVIMNRVTRKDYPNTVKEVLAEEGQYSSYQDERWYSEVPTQRECEIAWDIYHNGVRVFPENVVYQSKECFGNVVYESEWHQYGAK